MPIGAQLVRVSLVAAFIALIAAPTLAADAPAAAPATPVDEFAKEYKQFKEDLAALPKKIEETSRTVESNANPANAQQQLDALRGIVAEALKQVADDGAVARMGNAAVEYAEAKLKEMEQDTHFTKPQRDYLITQWKQTVQVTRDAVKDLNDARKELAGLLRTLQSNEDFLKELEALNNASKTVEVIKSLTADLKEISVHLRNILQRMTMPSM